MSDPSTIVTGAQAAADMTPYIQGIVGTVVSAGVTTIAHRYQAKFYLAAPKVKLP